MLMDLKPGMSIINKLHRLDGPAAEWFDGGAYCIHGIKITSVENIIGMLKYVYNYK